MAVIHHDNFTEASDLALTSHTPDVAGAGYTQVLITGTAVLQVIGATDELGASASATLNGQLVKINTAPTNAEYDIEYVCNVTDTGSANRYWGVLARISDSSATNYYGVKHRPTGHASADCMLYKMIGGTQTVLGSIDTGITAGDVFILEIRNGSQRLLKNGTAILTASDTEITAAGDIGIYNGQVKSGDTGNIHINWRWDSFKVTEVDAATFGPPPMAQVRLPYAILAR